MPRPHLRALRRLRTPLARGAALGAAALCTARCATARPGASLDARVAADDAVHVTTFGDSNTDWAVEPGDPPIITRSYVSDLPPRLAPDAPNAAGQLAGLVESRWRVLTAAPIRTVNHGIAGTTSGGGARGGADRNRNGAPNAGTVVGGVTRFEGEVLGRGYPWSGGEPKGAAYPGGPIRRVQAYVPGPRDFVYVSIGTNDFADAGMPAAQTLANIGWMVERWTGAGRAADHFVVTTLAPRQDRPALDTLLPNLNAGIRSLAARTGVGLIDLSAHTSPDDGRTWRDSTMHIGDRLHYTTPVRAWIADQLVAYMRAHDGAGAR